MKSTLLLTYSTNILVPFLTVNMKNCLTPKNTKMCDPILVTLLKMRSHYSQYGRENATPSSGKLASYKEVPHPSRDITLTGVQFNVNSGALAREARAAEHHG